MARWTTGTWAVCALAGGKKKPASVRAEGNQGLTFVREGEGAIVEVAPPQAVSAAAGEAKGGKSTETPLETSVDDRKSRAAQPGPSTAAAPQGRKKQDRTNS